MKRLSFLFYKIFMCYIFSIMMRLEKKDVKRTSAERNNFY